MFSEEDFVTDDQGALKVGRDTFINHLDQESLDKKRVKSRLFRDSNSCSRDLKGTSSVAHLFADLPNQTPPNPPFPRA